MKQRKKTAKRRIRKPAKRSGSKKSHEYYVFYPRDFANEYDLYVYPKGAKPRRGAEKITRQEFIKLMRRRHYGDTIGCKKCGYIPALPTWLEGERQLRHRG